ncbi:hypothetical protein JTF06_01010 [Desemzia sp. RIT804]|uniref:hypothetical protein n=1 Tax=Desemzia sp. RIT 804 TaxID=2810209 RepID=UPI0019506EC1|nr:hypothetical protein [Desemzia sp. RIT 804]MBM6613469.1 hypothetical protein [Desemzia sp. RIT 804]
MKGGFFVFKLVFPVTFSRDQLLTFLSCDFFKSTVKKEREADIAAPEYKQNAHYEKKFHSGRFHRDLWSSVQSALKSTT